MTIEEYAEAKRLGEAFTGFGRSPLTIHTYIASLRRVEQLLEKPLADVCISDANKLLVAMREVNLSPASKNRILAALKGFFNWAIETEQYEGRNPFMNISSEKNHSRLPRILDRTDIQRFFDGVDKRGNEKYSLFFRLMYFGALRMAEACSLEKRNIFSDHIVVNGKGNKERYIPLPESVMVRLREFVTTHSLTDYVFYNESAHQQLVNKPMSSVQVYTVFHAVKKELNLAKELHPHNLRHTSASHLHEATGDLAITQNFLGHASPTTTMIYVRINQSKVKSAATKAFGD